MTFCKEKEKKNNEATKMYSTFSSAFSGSKQKINCFVPSFKITFQSLFGQTQVNAKRNMSKLEIPVQTDKLRMLIKTTVVPRLTDNKHKGQYGRIGVVGGSLEYTGAPYFAAISALKVGADLAHVFCQKDAAVVIKSYSPELIVHPILDAENAVELIEPWLERLHVLVIGPGLGREPKIQEVTKKLIQLCQQQSLPLVIDADGLVVVKDNIELLSGKTNIVLTPNAIEFRRLFSANVSEMRKQMSQLGDGVIVVEKGMEDRIHIPSTCEVYKLEAGGTGRRCGGQGDLLCGALATFFHWSLESNQSNPAFLAAFAATHLVKQCNEAAYRKHGRSMLASDMLNEISHVFREQFESDNAC